MAAIIKETQSIKQAVTLINGIDPGKFPRLLSRVLQKLHLKAERSFSEEEEEKLQSAFSLEKQDLQLILETVSFILEQAVYHNVKPASLQQQLENVHLKPEKAEAFAQAWATTGQETVEKFRQRMFAPKKLESVGWQLSLQMAQSTQAKMKSPRAVLELGVRSEDSESFFIMLGYGCKPGSLKEKTTTNQYFWDMPATGQVYNPPAGKWHVHCFTLEHFYTEINHRSNSYHVFENSEKMFVEFSHEELLDFYNKLETIQAQLDSLT